MRAHTLRQLRPLGSLTVSRPLLARAATTATTSRRTANPSASIKPSPRSAATAASRAPYSASTPPSTPPPTPPSDQPLPTTSVLDTDPELELIANTHVPGSSPPSSAFASALSLSSSHHNSNDAIDWSTSYHGLSTAAFPPETAAILMAELNPLDVEMKPDGIIYLPEIKYRRILNKAFGPGGWGLAPRGELIVGEKVVTREFALVVNGRFIAEARGECAYFSEETIPTAGEGCKSNALRRCCKDLGIASELWDPRYIREFKKKHAEEVWVEHVVNKRKRQIWKRKDAEPQYPYQLVKK
ncbi:hypothetical protein OQA88_6992 [Cercophora sp. LCS_1]